MPISTKQTILLLAISFFLSNSAFTQQDLKKDYSPLKSMGSVPSILTESTESKITRGMKISHPGMSKEEQLHFLEDIHYGIYELLSSGKVVFGDETATYVQSVASRLLKDEPELRKELQFYVLKSNLTNALSTDQGVIFITLGLLSQLENEAQLAFIISHEISHYVSGHVKESFKERSTTTKKREKFDDRIARLSTHSKEAEFEADRLALERYHAAGYSKDEVSIAFDVLMYSYLPFDEIKLPLDYFNSENLFVPEQLFPKEINQIKANEDYDDSKSSHPNIRKRRSSVNMELKEYKNWGDKEFLLPKEDFLYVRSLARMEGLRLDILNMDLSEALYRVFLLDQNYPDNLYLNRCKANIWLTLTSFKLKNKISQVVSRPTSVEGETHAMTYFIYKLGKLQTVSVAMRTIEDISKKFPEDKQIEQIRSEMIYLMAGYEKYSISDLFTVSFQEAIDAKEKAKVTDEADTTANKEVLSKYDRIRENRMHSPTGNSELDTMKFYLFALSDLAKSDDFLNEYQACKDKHKEEKEDSEYLSGLSRIEWRREMAKRRKGYSKIIIIEPVFIQRYHDEVQLKESVLKESQITELTLMTADKYGIDVVNLAKTSTNLSVEDINERALLNDYAQQLISYGSNSLSPIDYTQILKIKNRYGDVPVLFVFGSSRPARDLSDRRTKLNFFLLNLATAKVDYADVNSLSGKPSKSLLKLYLSELMTELDSK